jgi:hypothetical protein
MYELGRGPLRSYSLLHFFQDVPLTGVSPEKGGETLLGLLLTKQSRFRTHKVSYIKFFLVLGMFLLGIDFSAAEAFTQM